MLICALLFPTVYHDQGHVLQPDLALTQHHAGVVGVLFLPYLPFRHRYQRFSFLRINLLLYRFLPVEMSYLPYYQIFWWSDLSSYYHALVPFRHFSPLLHGLPFIHSSACVGWLSGSPSVFPSVPCAHALLFPVLRWLSLSMSRTR